MLAEPDHPELSIDALTKWLRTQEPDEVYRWHDPVFCLMGRYLAAHGSSWGAAQYSDLPNYEQIAGQKPWTFGAALERAEKLLALPAPCPVPTSEMLSEMSVAPEPLPAPLPEIELQPIKPPLQIPYREGVAPPRT